MSTDDPDTAHAETLAPGSEQTTGSGQTTAHAETLAPGSGQTTAHAETLTPGSGETRSTAPKIRAPAEPLRVGQRLGGRYVVQTLLGKGGMGIVYRALDEQLGEAVALKLLRGDSELLRDEVRLAQKVTHANVCRTYDLEVIEGQQLVKMEYIAGETLAARIAREGPLPIDEVLRIGRAVADGLAAAHAKGIAHRDLKPGNVMLAGEAKPDESLPRDRVVLMDFGIASVIDNARDTIAGTVGYMSPEQIQRGTVDVRADYYALGCVVFEMLAGRPVFAGDAMELVAHHVSTRAPDVRTLREDTPRWLARAVRRMLAKQPAERTAGFALLRSGPRRARIAIPIAAVAVAGIVVGSLAFAMRARAAAPCRGIDSRLAGVWDAGVKAKVKAAFAATNKPYAATAFAALERELDRYTGEWLAASIDSCRATRVRREQTERVLALRQSCLDQRLAHVRALTQLLVESDPVLVDKADQIVRGLDAVALCSNVALLAAPDELPPRLVPQAQAIDRYIATAHANLLAFRTLPGLVAAQHAVDAARRDPQLGAQLAGALLLRGLGLQASGNLPDSSAAFREAALIAFRTHREDVFVWAGIMLGMLAAGVQSHIGEARIWLDLSRAAATHYDFEPAVARQYYTADGVIASLENNMPAAIAAHEHAFAAARSESERGAWGEELVLAATLTKAEVYDKAASHFEHALATREQLVGPDHPEIAAILTNLGVDYASLGDHAKAHHAFERALAIREREYGPNNPLLVTTLNNFADQLMRAGDLDAALSHAGRAKTLALQFFGADDASYHVPATTYAEVLGRTGKLAEARRQLDEVIASELRVQSPALGASRVARADLELSVAAWREAERFAELGIADFEKAGGADNPELVRPLVILGKARLALHDEAARAPLERAIAIGEKAGMTKELAEARKALP